MGPGRRIGLPGSPLALCSHRPLHNAEASRSGATHVHAFMGPGGSVARPSMMASSSEPSMRWQASTLDADPHLYGHIIGAHLQPK